MSKKRVFFGVVLVAAISVCSLASGAELFPALRNGRLGYSDQNGQILIPCRFERTFPGDWGNSCPVNSAGSLNSTKVSRLFPIATNVEPLIHPGAGCFPRDSSY